MADLTFRALTSFSAQECSRRRACRPATMAGGTATRPFRRVRLRG